MKTDVFIFGMGNMGRRHFQGISRLDCYNKVYAFDNNPEVLKIIDQFCSDNDVDRSNLIICDSLDEIISKISSQSIVIVATTAMGRVELLGSITAKKPRAVIVEKPLCQDNEEYQKTLKMREDNKVPIYIDFQRHMYPYYQNIFSEIKNLKPRNFHVDIWGGMACVGIHVFELMTWLFRIEKYKIIHSSCYSIYESRRKGFSDFVGDIVLLANDDIICSLSVTKDESLQTISISTENRQYRINETINEMIISDGLTSEKKEKAEAFYVSQLIGPVVQDILKGPEFVKLPDVKQCYLAHKILFDYMKAHSKKGIYIT